MFKELRYLLHGKPDEYFNEETLYIISEVNDLWVRLVARQVLDRNNQSWRLIDPDLAKLIPEAKFKELNLSRFTPEEVVKLLQKLGAESVKSEELTPAQQETLLTYLGQNTQNERIWKSLSLHRTVDGKLVSIGKNTYLENRNFPLPDELKNMVILIQRNTINFSLLGLQQQWIPQWDADSAIEFLLEQERPDNHRDIIQQIWKSHKSDLKSRYENKLKATPWLRLTSGEVIAPKYILKLPDNLASYTNQLILLYPGYHSASDLDFPEYKLGAINSLFYHWNETDVIKFLLQQEQPNWKIIIAALDSLLNKNSDKLIIPENIREDLKEKQWLIDENNRLIAPSKIINTEFNHFDLKNEATEILNRVNSEYITISMLDRSIKIPNKVREYLQNSLFIKGNKALEKIGEGAAQLTSYYLGEFQNFPLKDALEVFEEINSDILPCWGLIKKVARGRSLEDCQRYILPHLLQEIEEEQLIKLLNWLSDNYKASDETAIRLYNQYLSIAANNYDFNQNILSNILLLNRAGTWKCTNLLSRYNDNIDDRDILNEEQENILKSRLNKVIPNSSQENIDNQLEIPQNKSEILAEYFQDWQHISPEIIGSFLCLIAGNNQELISLAQSFLGRRKVSDIRLRLTQKETMPDLLSSSYFKIQIKSSEETTQDLPSLTGQFFAARIKHQDSLPNDLFVNQLTPQTREITLLPIKNPQNYQKQQLHDILKKSSRKIIVGIYEVDQNDLTESIDDVWTDLTKSEQLDIQVSKNVILNSISDKIEMLGLDKKNNQIREKLNKLNQSIHDREYYRNSGRDILSIDNMIDTLKQELGELLENDNQVSADLLQAVRDKIKFYGYRFESIPFEIFQNADDALEELEMMIYPQPVAPSRLQFIIEFDENKIMMMYWGRPINCFRHPENRNNDYTERGFDRDLQKMLSFHQSNKYNSIQSDSSGESLNIKPTGKYGLGFKSVYLISQEPHVLSHRIEFKIVAGLLPCKLKSIDLRQKLENHNAKLLDGTIIQLKLDPKVKTNSELIINEFKELASILLIFSRKVKKVKIIDKNKHELSFDWNPQRFLGEKSIEIGKIAQIDGCGLCLKIANVGDLLIVLNETKREISADLPKKKNIPNIWVTAPTQERLGLNFIINAQFDVNTGRSTLNIKSDHNLKLARQLGELLGEELCKLFNLANNNWDTFQQRLELRDTTQYQFWQLIWKELAVSWLNKEAQGTFSIIQEILGVNKGMGYFVTRCQALPNGLWGDYQSLVFPEKVRYRVDGILKHKEYFNLVFQWQKVKEKYQQNTIIHADVWKEFEKLLRLDSRPNIFRTEELKILKILQWQLRDSQADILTAKLIGQLINSRNLEEIKQKGLSEYQDLIDWLHKIQFLSQAGKYEVNQNLLLLTSKNEEETSKNEEKLIAAFAPDDRLLHVDYTDTAIAFFDACRFASDKQRKSISVEDIPVEVLQEWVLRAETTEKRKAIYDYLSNGKHRDQLAKLLHENSQDSWIKKDQIINRLIYHRMMAVITDRENEYQRVEPTDSNVQTDQQGVGDNSEKWGKFGEDAAKLFYEKLGYDDVTKQPDEGGYGYDFLCVKADSELFVEVKAINPTNDIVRITKNEWSAMCTNSDKYELFIVCHMGTKITKMIRIKSAWKTLQEVFSQLDQQTLTDCKYRDKVNVLIGLQLNENGSANEILLNWTRLVKPGLSKNIEFSS